MEGGKNKFTLPLSPLPQTHKCRVQLAERRHPPGGRSAKWELDITLDFKYGPPHHEAGFHSPRWLMAASIALGTSWSPIGIPGKLPGGSHKPRPYLPSGCFSSNPGSSLGLRWIARIFGRILGVQTPFSFLHLLVQLSQESPVKSALQCVLVKSGMIHPKCWKRKPLPTKNTLPKRFLWEMKDSTLLRESINTKPAQRICQTYYMRGWKY